MFENCVPALPSGFGAEMPGRVGFEDFEDLEAWQRDLEACLAEIVALLHVAVLDWTRPRGYRRETQIGMIRA